MTDPEHLYGLSPVNDQDANTKALNRLAQALEQLTLTIMDKSLPANLQAVTAAPLTALPPVQPLTVNPQSAGNCPVHRVPWRMVPAGVSKKTGNAYKAFLACPERGCDQRPPQ